jgi:hypothetical protein
MVFRAKGAAVDATRPSLTKFKTVAAFLKKSGAKNFFYAGAGTFSNAIGPY